MLMQIGTAADISTWRNSRPDFEVLTLVLLSSNRLMMMVIMIGDLNARRRKLVKMAFDSIDSNRTGVVTVQEMLSKYDVSQNPDVKVVMA